jgi:hypothetical protein
MFLRISFLAWAWKKSCSAVGVAEILEHKLSSCLPVHPT